MFTFIKKKTLLLEKLKRSRLRDPEVSQPATTYCHGCAVKKTRDAMIAFFDGYGCGGCTVPANRLIKQFLHPQRTTSDLGSLGGKNLGECFVCQDRVKWKEMVDCPHAECITYGKDLCFDCIRFSCESGHLYFAHGF